MRGIRQLRRPAEPRGQKENQAPGSQQTRSKRQHDGGSGSGKSRINAARAYLSDRVDPLMAEIINYLLLEQPAEADLAILNYLEGRRIGKPPRPVTSGASRTAVLKDRRYMAKQVQPILEVLMRRVVDEQPYDVEAHFIKQLVCMRAVPAGSASVPEAASTSSAPIKKEMVPQQQQVQEATPAQVAFAPREMSKGACDALFRMLDEDGEGSMTVAVIVERIKKLNACGVPIDATALAFWGRIDLSSVNISGGSADPLLLAERRLDRDRFFGTMGRVCLSSEKWLSSGVTPKLGDYIILSVEDETQPQQACEKVDAVAPAAMDKEKSDVQEEPKVGFVVGAKVLVNYRKSGNFFPGKLAKENENGTFDIAYDDGDSEKQVKRNMIQPLGLDGQPLPLDQEKEQSSPEKEKVRGADSASPAALAVGCRVEVRFRGKGNWYKGRLVAEDGHGTFSVAYDDGDSEDNVVPANVKLLSDDGKDTVIVVPGTATDLASDSNGGAKTGSHVAVDLSHVKPVVALVGIKGGGKSTLLKAMGGDPEPKPRPTTGFMQRKLQFEVRGVPVLVHWYDLPGGWTSKWETYLTEVHGLVYVVDSAAEEANFAAAVDAFKGPVMEDNARVVSGKPMLVLANKQDEGADKARSGAAVAKALDLAALCGVKGEDVVVGDSDDVVQGAGWRVEACSCHPMKVNPGGESQFDTRVEKGLEWLLESIVDGYEALESRVKVSPKCIRFHYHHD